MEVVAQQSTSHIPKSYEKDEEIAQETLMDFNDKGLRDPFEDNREEETSFSEDEESSSRSKHPKHYINFEKTKALSLRPKQGHQRSQEEFEIEEEEVDALNIVIRQKA